MGSATFCKMTFSITTLRAMGHLVSVTIKPIVLVEIALEQAPFVVLVYFFPHLNMQKTC
jgi:hypothetical protein